MPAGPGAMARGVGRSRMAQRAGGRIGGRLDVERLERDVVHLDPAREHRLAVDQPRRTRAVNMDFQTVEQPLDRERRNGDQPLHAGRLRKADDFREQDARIAVSLPQRVRPSGEDRRRKSRDFPHVRRAGRRRVAHQIGEHLAEQVGPRRGQQAGASADIAGLRFADHVNRIGTIELIDLEPVDQRQWPAEFLDEYRPTIIAECCLDGGIQLRGAYDGRIDHVCVLSLDAHIRDDAGILRNYDFLQVSNFNHESAGRAIRANRIWSANSIDIAGYLPVRRHSLWR
ncbi:hypothetical protein DP42_2794 [Burkholderia pseudomallei]|nr:hypothetical protein DP42_2794 [Burkholderia pseudomallei]